MFLPSLKGSDFKASDLVQRADGKWEGCLFEQRPWKVEPGFPGEHRRIKLENSVPEEIAPNAEKLKTFQCASRAGSDQNFREMKYHAGVVPPRKVKA